MSLNTVELPDDAPVRLRSILGLSDDEPVRISYVAGPGDVVGTYAYWREHQHDPRVPVITYSGMFYDLVDRLGAKAQIVTQASSVPPPGEQFEFVSLSRRASGGRLDYMRGEAEYVGACVHVVDRFAPHVVVVATDMAAAAWEKLGHGRRLILSAHNSFWPMGRKPSGLKSRIKLPLLAFRARAIDAAVCTSAECMRQLAEVTGSRVRGRVETPQIVAEYPIEPRNGPARRLLFLGRIESSKGVFLLLESFLRLGDSGLVLEYAGTGTADAELRSRIAASGATNIRHLGLLDSDGVHAAIAATDVVVCPTTTSFSEGLALVAFEAAAHGIPSLLSSVVPAADTLGKGCMVFEADSADALTAALRTVTTDAAAYRAMTENLSEVRSALYDRSRSWGSQLGAALLSL